jgi:hypothetical protein
MNIPASQEPRLVLAANQTVRSIASSCGDMLQFIDANESAVIELAEDIEVDISFIQMIEAARIYADTAGKGLALAQPATGALLEALRRSGFLEGMSAQDTKFWLHQGDIQ